LTDKGYDCDIINYQPEYFNYGRNKLKSIAGRLLNLKSYEMRKKKFNAFIAENIKDTEKVFRTSGELNTLVADESTVFVAGGDQLWNDYHPCGRDSAYKLSFVGKGRKLAYGTSLGRSNYAPGEAMALADEISGFESVMIRESSSVPILAPYLKIPVYHVIDPVGLLNFDDFAKVAKKPDIKGRYAVMYLADSSPLLDKAIKLLSKKLGLKIVHICGFKKKCECDVFLKDAGPDEILGYVMNADFVLSASFHATMFSILFNKQFASILPGANTNARIEDILNFFGLENRIISDESNLGVLSERINFDEANKILDSFRDKSKKLLIEALEYKTV